MKEVCQGDISDLPREMQLEELISILIAEHAEMKRDSEVRRAVSEADFPPPPGRYRSRIASSSSTLPTKRRRVLRILIDGYGMQGADDAIKVFRHHRPIYNPMGT